MSEPSSNVPPTSGVLRVGDVMLARADGTAAASKDEAAIMWTPLAFLGSSEVSGDLVCIYGCTLRQRENPNAILYAYGGRLQELQPICYRMSQQGAMVIAPLNPGSLMKELSGIAPALVLVAAYRNAITYSYHAIGAIAQQTHEHLAPTRKFISFLLDQAGDVPPFIGHSSDPQPLKDLVPSRDLPYFTGYQFGNRIEFEAKS